MGTIDGQLINAIGIATAMTSLVIWVLTIAIYYYVKE